MKYLIIILALPVIALVYIYVGVYHLYVSILGKKTKKVY